MVLGLLTEQGDVLLDAVVATAGVGEDVAVDAAGVGEQVAQRDLLGDVGVGEAQLRQHLDDRGVEVGKPSSTSCITTVAVQTLVIEPIWKIESAVTGCFVSRLSRPYDAVDELVVAVPAWRRMPSWAPGTRCLAASFASRRSQWATSMRGRPPWTAYRSTHSTTRRL